jgi:putative membrane protein
VDAILLQFAEPGMWNLWLNAGLILLGAIYLIRTRAPQPGQTEEAVSSRKKTALLLGLLLFNLAVGSPLSFIGHELFSVHMLQQSVLFLAVPPLVLSGLPAGWVRAVFRWRPVKQAVSFFTHPLVALLVFNGLFSFYHVPFIFDTLMGNPMLHVTSHAVLTAAAFAMWWPVFCPLPEQDRLTPLRKMAYICAAGVLLTPACALIIFADQLLFASYSGVQLIPLLDPLDDQQLGGVVMKILQEGIYGCVLGVIFFRWVRLVRGRETYGVPVEEEEEGV